MNEYLNGLKKYLGEKDHTSHLPLCLLIVIVLNIFHLFNAGVLPRVLETHFLISNLDNNDVNSDLVNQYYLILKTPIYFFLNYLMSSQLAYILFSYIIETIVAVLIFFIGARISLNPLATTIAWIMLSPTFHSEISPFLGSWLGIQGFKFFQPISYLFGWGELNFSVRHFVTILYLLTIYQYFRKNEKLGILFATSILLIHPSSGILIVSMILIFEFIILLKNKSQYSRFFLAVFLAIIFFIPTAIKVYSSTYLDTNGSDDISNYIYWYSNTIRDEADDFSVIFWNINYSFTVIFQIVFIITTVFLHSIVFKKNHFTNFLITLSLTPILFYFIFWLIEISIFYFPSKLGITLLMGFQPGSKLLAYSIFPILFLWCNLLSKFINKYLLKKFDNTYTYSSYMLLLVSIFLMFKSLPGFFIAADHLSEIKKILPNKSAYHQRLLIESRLTDYKNPSLPKIFLLKKDISSYSEMMGKKSAFELKNIENNTLIHSLDKQYQNKYGNIDAFDNFLSLIKNNVPLGSGIVIPPYMFHIRDSLTSYNIFFQEHHDGNLMLGGIGIFNEITKRMKLTIGIDYLSLPTQNSGLNYSFMRSLFLKRDANDFKEITIEYPKYNYLITEENHNLSLDLVAKNDHYSIYKF